MKIVIVDDDILVSSALKTILEAGGEVEVTGTGQDGKDAGRLYDELLPDVLLMDIRMKDMNGLDAAEQILKRHTDAKILLLTTFSDDEYIVKALKYGVKGYLIKQDYGSILPALQRLCPESRDCFRKSRKKKSRHLTGTVTESENGNWRSQHWLLRDSVTKRYRRKSA